MHRPTSIFIGTRAEALQALRTVTKVNTIICMFGSHAHALCEKEGWAATILTAKDRKFSQEIIQSIKENILLSAGFPWIIDEATLSATPTLKLNSHPSLLPLYPGKNAIKDAFHAGCTNMGVTVHHITPTVDGGPVVASEETDVRGLSLHEIYQKMFSIIEPRVIIKSINLINSESTL